MSSAPNFSNNFATSSVFGQQNSSPHFGGVPTTTPLFGPQSSNVSSFGRGYGASSFSGQQRPSFRFAVPSTSTLGAQSSSFSGFGGVPSTSTLGAQSSSFSGFGGVPSTSTFGQQSSSFSGFGAFSTCHSDAARGGTFTPSFFGPQSSNAPVFSGASSMPSVSPFRCTTTQQQHTTFHGPTGIPSTSPFGTVPSTSPFGPQGSSFSSFGGASTSSPFGPQSSNAPVFSGASSGPSVSPFRCTTPQKQHTTFHWSTGIPTTSPFGPQSSSFSSFGGVASTSSPFGPQSSNASVFSGASSGPSVSPFRCTTPQQQHTTFHGPTGIPSTSPFGTVPSTSPFGPQSSSFSGFGGVASTSSPFGPQSSNASVFSGDTTPQQQHTTFHGPTGIPTTSPFGSQSSSFSSFGGVASTPSPFGQQSSNAPVFNGASSTPSGFTFQHPFVTMTGNSNKGTRLTPYAPTPEGTFDLVLTSISAMDAYNNKSHEELRLEDYKLQRIDGLNPATATSSSSSFGFHSSPFVTSNFAPIHSSDSELKSSGSGTPPTDRTCCACSEFYKNQTPNVNVDPTAPQTSVANQTSSANINSTTPQTNAAANQTSSVNVTNQTSSSAEASPVGSSFSPASVNSITSAFGAFGLNGESLGVPSLNLLPGTTPVFVPTVVAFIPQQLPLVSPLPIPPSDVQTIPRTDTAVAPGQPTRFVYSAAPVSSATSTSIPKGLEIIVQTLGVNPWAGKDDCLDDFPSGKILACEDAATDPDIASLAEFAVEQHNATDKDNQFKLSKVNVACLEAVDGGRYHVVLEAFKDPSQAIRFYAVVLRKKTDHPTHLIVLEKWLQGLVL